MCAEPSWKSIVVVSTIVDNRELRLDSSFRIVEEFKAAQCNQLNQQTIHVKKITLT